MTFASKTLAQPPPHLRALRSAFSLIELVIVVVIIGVVATIAVPRMSSGASNAKSSAVIANARTLQQAIDVYIAEHEGRTPAHQPDGSLSTDGEQFAKRLTLGTNVDASADGPFGPYLREVPVNPMNGLSTIRMNLGSPPGASTAGWLFHPGRRLVVPDDPVGSDLWLRMFTSSAGAGGKGGSKTFLDPADFVAVNVLGGGLGGGLGGK